MLDGRIKLGVVGMNSTDRERHLLTVFHFQTNFRFLNPPLLTSEFTQFLPTHSNMLYDHHLFILGDTL